MRHHGKYPMKITLSPDEEMKEAKMFEVVGMPHVPAAYAVPLCSSLFYGRRYLLGTYVPNKLGMYVGTE